MELRQTIIVLADISGYTKFLQLHTMSLLHAEKIVTELMEAIIDATDEPLNLNKLQGDSLLFYAFADQQDDETGRAVLAQVERFFEAFRNRSQALTGCNNLCPCQACREADQLRLKTIVHFGEVAIKQVRQFEELAGEEVILAHRLLKNTIPSSEYILMTKEFSDLSGGFSDGEVEARSEVYPDVGTVPVTVHYPKLNSGSTAPVTDEPQRFRSSLANAIKLDGYSLARVIGLKKPPPAFTNLSERKPRFLGFVIDGLKGLAMLLRERLNRHSK